MVLFGCVTGQKQKLRNIITPGPDAHAIHQSPLLRVMVGENGYFATRPDAMLVDQIILDTWQDITRAGYVSMPTIQWTVLWHHPDSPAGQTLLAHTNRNPPMRGITVNDQHGSLGTDHST